MIKKNTHTKQWNKSPLPFQGQKRNWKNHFKKLITESKAEIIVDVFGGSGLLSRFAKDAKPEATVIYNDFDGYSERLKKINDTNEIRLFLTDLLVGCEKRKKIGKEIKEQICEFLETTDLFVDYHTIGSWLLFSGNWANNLKNLKAGTFYNSVISSLDLDVGSYLDGLTVVDFDFKKLISDFLGRDNVLFLLDPPYINTHQKYNDNEKYFDFWSQVALLELMKEMNHFIYFSSNKSDIGKGYDQELEIASCFKNCKIEVIKSNVSHSSSYQDMMFYK